MFLVFSILLLLSGIGYAIYIIFNKDLFSYKIAFEITKFFLSSMICFVSSKLLEEAIKLNE